jgi:hypothetical protein
MKTPTQAELAQQALQLTSGRNVLDLEIRIYDKMRSLNRRGSSIIMVNNSNSDA